MRVDNIVTDKDSITVTVRHKGKLFGIINNFVTTGGVLESITDYIEHFASDEACVVVSYKANFVYGKIFRRKHVTQCYKLYIDENKLKTWVDGIQTREIDISDQWKW